MPLTKEEALALAPGDRLTIDGHETPFTVTSVEARRDGSFRVYVVRDDWEGDQATYFEHHHLDTVSGYIDPKASDVTPTDNTEGAPSDDPEDGTDKPRRGRPKK